ncbi:MAG: HK97 gp10 family phage protein [Turicibacter sp.]|nr:HK97 gp10 family phage protein [Turicibacter sp.]
MEILNGCEELAAELAEMAKKTADKGVQKAVLEAGADVLVKAAVGNVNNRTGNLRRNIGSEYLPDSAEMRIGYTKDGFYGRFLEFGYRAVGRARRRGRAGGFGRFVRRPIVIPAWEDNAGAVLSAMLAEYEKNLG